MSWMSRVLLSGCTYWCQSVCVVKTHFLPHAHTDAHSLAYLCTYICVRARTPINTHVHTTPNHD